MGVFKWPKRVFPPWFCITIAAESRSVLSSDRSATLSAPPRFSRKNAFLQAEISGIDLHAVIFMVEQAVQNIDAFASGFVAAQVFSHFFFDALQRLGRAIAQFDFFLVP